MEIVEEVGVVGRYGGGVEKRDIWVDVNFRKFFVGCRDFGVRLVGRKINVVVLNKNLLLVSSGECVNNYSLRILFVGIYFGVIFLWVYGGICEDFCCSIYEVSR